MRVRREAGGALQIVERPVVLRVALIVGAVIVPWAVVSAQPAANREPLRVGLGVLAGVFLLVVALLVESGWFRFDPALKVLRWRRSRLLWRRAGELPFSAILGATALPRIDEDSRQRRFTYQPVLQTAIGELPLSSSSSHRAEDYDVLLGLIREMIGQVSGDQEDTIANLVRAGRTIEATTMARRALGLSLTDANQHVRRIREHLNGTDRPAG